MNFIEELYYGNINPNEKKVNRDTQLSKAIELFSKNENELMEKLSKDDKKLFADMVNASDVISACTSIENFKIGFILGVRMMVDCFKEDAQSPLRDL